MVVRPYSLVVLALLFSCSWAHMCLISPPQRGSMEDINTPNTPDCGRTTGPCGGEPIEIANTAFFQYTNYTVTWQKNENHWFEDNPGSFNLSWASATDPEQFYPIFSFADDNSSSLTLYSYILDVSAVWQTPGKAVILQLAYNAPGLPAVFYQCADVLVV